MMILGVDPGVYGGMAFVHDDKDTAPIVFRMPMDGTGRHGYDLPSIMDIIFDLLPDVLVIEKTNKIGGTTAYSAGSIWAPNSRHNTNIEDSFESALQYLLL